MPVEARTRMISFRLSEEEFERFQRYCEERRIRSISEMARMAIERVIDLGIGGREESLEARMTGLEARLEGLSREIEDLREGRLTQAVDEKSRATSAGRA